MIVPGVCTSTGYMEWVDLALELGKGLNEISFCRKLGPGTSPMIDRVKGEAGLRPMVPDGITID